MSILLTNSYTSSTLHSRKLLFSSLDGKFGPGDIFADETTDESRTECRTGDSNLPSWPLWYLLGLDALLGTSSWFDDLEYFDGTEEDKSKGDEASAGLFIEFNFLKIGNK